MKYLFLLCHPFFFVVACVRLANSCYVIVWRRWKKTRTNSEEKLIQIILSFRFYSWQEWHVSFSILSPF